MTITPSNKPTVKKELFKIVTTTPVAPESVNPNMQTLLDNDMALLGMLDGTADNETGLAGQIKAKQDWHHIINAPLTVAGWTANKDGSYSQDIALETVDTTDTVIVSATPESTMAYGAASVSCTAKETGKLTFSSKSLPDADISVNIVAFKTKEGDGVIVNAGGGSKKDTEIIKSAGLSIVDGKLCMTYQKTT